MSGWQQVQEVLGCDEPRARQLFQAAGSVEGAVNLHLAADDGAGDLGAPLLTPGPPTPRRQPRAQNVVAEQPPDGWKKALWYVRRFFAFIARFCTSIFERRSFQDEFERSYGQHPKFFEGNFRNALVRGERESKLVVAYLHCEAAQRTQEFCKEVLGCQQIIEALDSDFIFWVGDILTMEVYELARALRVREYPAVYILLPTNGTAGQPNVEHALHGRITADGLLAQLLQAKDRAAPRLVHSHVGNVRAEQDREYEEAVEHDRKLQAAKQAEVEKRQAEEAKVAQEAAAAVSAAADRSARRARLAEEFKARPAVGAPKCRIQLRFEAGKAVGDFGAQSLVKEVLDWAEACEVLHGFAVPASLQLVMSYPPKELTDPGCTLESAGLCPSATLLVRDKEA